MAATTQNPGELIAILNNESAAPKQKLNAVVALSTMALEGSRRDVFQALLALEESFEKNLTDKEEGRKRYGTALGPMHEAVLVLLFRARDYEFPAQDVLEFARGDRILAMSLLLSVLKVTSYEERLKVAVCRTLAGMATPAAFLPQSAGAGEIEASSIQNTIDGFDALADQCIAGGLIKAICTPLHQLFFASSAEVPANRHAALIQCMGHTYSFVQSVCQFSSKSALKFRQHLGVASEIVPLVLLPHLRCCITLIQRSPHEIDHALLTSTNAALKMLVVCTYQSDHCMAVRESPLLLDLLSLPVIGTSVPTTANALMLLTNLDAFVRAPATPAGASCDTLRQVVQAMTSSSQHREAIATALEAADVRSPPLSRSNTTYECIEDWLSVAITVVPVSPRPVSRVAHARDPDAPPSPFPSWPAAGGGSSGTGTPAGSRAAATTNEPSSPTWTAAPQQQKQQNERASSSSSPPRNLNEVARESSLSSSSKGGGGGSVHASSNQNHNEEGGASSSSSVNLTSLSGMPSLLPPGKKPAERAKRQAERRKQADRLAAEAPERFRCALDGHLMKEPVKSVHGHVFEKSSIMRWFSNNGDICPISQKPLSAAGLEPHESLALAIQSWQIRTAMETEET